MKERGNTHYCFYCGGSHGFTPGPHGEALHGEDSSTYNPLANHDPVAHADGIIGRANKYSYCYEWLEGEIKRKMKRTFWEWLLRKPMRSFPFIVQQNN